ncbi:MAG TPA: hypothetical protein VM639_22215 [Dongiaceae bacterium]|nr:hypothetical protein [Dongiaceae bacterium]
MLSMFARREDGKEVRDESKLLSNLAGRAETAGQNRANPGLTGTFTATAKSAAAEAPAAVPAESPTNMVRLMGEDAKRRAKLLATAPSVGQYLCHLSHDMRNFTRAETTNAVIGATPAELQRVVRLAAKLRGRYLAQVVDLGNPKRGPITESDIRDLGRAREMYEEIDRGLMALRNAIESGDLDVDGTSHH